MQSHIIIAVFILGAALIAPTAEYLGMITKQARYERFARNLARLIVILFATGSALAIMFVLALVTLFSVFFSYLLNIFFWVFLVEAFMFLAVIIVLYAWYNVWDKLAYRKSLHVVFGFVAGFIGLIQMTMIDAVASYMLTPSEAPVNDVARTFLNPTNVPLNMHRFVGNFSYVVQPIIGYLKAIRESSPEAFDVIMLGDKAWLFNLLMVELAIMGIASVAYFVHKLRFAIKPMPTLRGWPLGAWVSRRSSPSST